MKLETFDEVLASMAKNHTRKFSLLLGNGFSVAYDRKIFSYNALHDFVTNLRDGDLATIFGVIETRNFELIMQYLDGFSSLIAAFGGDPGLGRRVSEAGDRLKKSLLDAVTALHPEHVFEVPESQSLACAKFLKRFLDTGGSLFSTNYDLLLYWVLMRNGILEHVDGCGRELENASVGYVSPEEQEWSELVWGKHRDGQNVFYLHGALQFFDSGVAITKEVYDVYTYLLRKITARMEKGEYPIFVTAGDGPQKMRHITHNQYLTHCYEALCRTQGSLVTYGFSFGQSDVHIIDAINKAAKNGRLVPDKLWSVYIGVYSEDDKRHVEQIQGAFKCKVRIYDAATARIWGT